MVKETLYTQARNQRNFGPILERLRSILSCFEVSYESFLGKTTILLFFITDLFYKLHSCWKLNDDRTNLKFLVYLLRPLSCPGTQHGGMGDCFGECSCKSAESRMIRG